MSTEIALGMEDYILTFQQGHLYLSKERKSSIVTVLLDYTGSTPISAFQSKSYFIVIFTEKCLIIDYETRTYKEVAFDLSMCSLVKRYQKDIKKDDKISFCATTETDYSMIINKSALHFIYQFSIPRSFPFFPLSRLELSQQEEDKLIRIFKEAKIAISNPVASFEEVFHSTDIILYRWIIEEREIIITKEEEISFLKMIFKDKKTEEDGKTNIIETLKTTQIQGFLSFAKRFNNLIYIASGLSLFIVNRNGQMISNVDIPIIASDMYINDHHVYIQSYLEIIKMKNNDFRIEERFFSKYGERSKIISYKYSYCDHNLKKISKTRN